MYRTDNFMPSVHAELLRLSRDDSLQCPQCRESYAECRRHPRLLSCLHAVCQACVDDHAGRQDIRCAVCLAPDVGGSCSPLDYPRLNQITLDAIKHNPEKIVCSFRKDGGMCRRYCFRCGHFLCDHCVKIHSELELTKEHKTVDLASLSSRTLDEWRPRKRCPAHPEYPVSSYCREDSCRKLVCLLCFTTEHAEHYTQNIDDAHDTERNNLKNVSKQLSSLIATLKAREPRRTRAEEQRQRIRAAFGKLRGTVTERHEYHLQILDQHYGEFQVGWEQSAREIREDLQTAKTFYDQAMSFSSDPRFKELEARASVQIDVPVPKNPDSHLVFIQVGLANLLQDIRTYGKLDTTLSQ